MEKIQYLARALFVGLLLTSNADATIIKGLFSKGFDSVVIDEKTYNVEEIYQKMMQIAGKINEEVSSIKGVITTAKGDAFNVKKNLELIHTKRKQSLRTSSKKEHSEGMLNIVTLLAMPNSWVDEHMKFGDQHGLNYANVKKNLIELRAMLPQPTQRMWYDVKSYLVSNKDITLRYGQSITHWWRVQDSWFTK
ncbi:MAG: hypothetical protein K2X53_05830 [Alphaproteobacteria bacterium]|nr:hypothetical protein [Alphaproteobacteria bacterium]